MDNDELIRALADGVMDGGRIDVGDSELAVIPDDDSGQLQALALQLWLYDAGQDMREVQILLEDRAGVLVPLAQLRDWRSKGKWAEVGVLIHQALVSNLVTSSRANLLLASQRATTYLLRVLSGTEEANPSKTRVAMTALDRGGFPVLMRGELVAGAHIGTDVGEYADMTDDELEAEYSSYSADDVGALQPEDTRYREPVLSNLTRRANMSVSVTAAR